MQPALADSLKAPNTFADRLARIGALSDSMGTWLGGRDSRTPALGGCPLPGEN